MPIELLVIPVNFKGLSGKRFITYNPPIQSRGINTQPIST